MRGIFILEFIVALGLAFIQSFANAQTMPDAASDKNKPEHIMKGSVTLTRLARPRASPAKAKPASNQASVSDCVARNLHDKRDKNFTKPFDGNLNTWPIRLQRPSPTYQGNSTKNVGSLVQPPLMTPFTGVFKGRPGEYTPRSPLHFVVTRIEIAKGKLTGIYTVHNPDAVHPNPVTYSGTLNVTGIKGHEVSLRWNDRYGQGDAHLKFNDSFTAFEGFWTSIAGEELFVWTGSRNLQPED